MRCASVLASILGLAGAINAADSSPHNALLGARSNLHQRGISSTGKLTGDPDWTYSKCMSDAVNGARSFTKQFPSTGSIKACLNSCQASGFAMCGLTYGGECFGGLGISRNSAEIPASACQMSCTSQPGATCGGVAALDVYVSNSVKPVTSADPIPSISGWAYRGCYVDPVNGNRVLNRGLPLSTVAGCIASCGTSPGICGVSYFGECWTAPFGTSASTIFSRLGPKVPDSQCECPCKENPSEWCGCAGRVMVWTPPGAGETTTTTTRAAEQPPPNNTPTTTSAIPQVTLPQVTLPEVTLPEVPLSTSTINTRNLQATDVSATTATTVIDFITTRISDGTTVIETTAITATTTGFINSDGDFFSPTVGNNGETSWVSAVPFQSIGGATPPRGYANQGSASSTKQSNKFIIFLAAVGGLNALL